MPREVVPQHVLPGVELEERPDHAGLRIRELPLARDPDLSQVHILRAKTRVAGGVGEELDRREVLLVGLAAQGGEVDHRLGREKRRKALREGLVDPVELIRAVRQDAAVALVLEPLPLEARALVERGGCVGVVFHHRGGTRAVVDEVEAPVEFALTGTPARAHQIPMGLRDVELREKLLGLHDPGRRLAAHRMKLRRRILDPRLDLFEREGVDRVLVPVGLAIHRVEGEAIGFGLRFPVGAGAKCGTVQREPPGGGQHETARS